jgi:6-phosphogluconolactonase
LRAEHHNFHTLETFMNMRSTRRQALRLLTLAAVAASIGAPAFAHDDDDGPGGSRRGQIFISTNSPSGNEVLVYARAANGPATLTSRIATRGVGTGGGLGSQGAVTLSGNGRYLFVVNAQSNSLSTFEVTEGGLVFRSVVDSGGLMPTSVAENDGLVYVLNAAGSGNVAGFRNRRGQLTAVADGVRGLSAAGGTAPAQVGFDRDGDVLLISERNTNVLTSYAVAHNGTLNARAVTPSAGRTPFGFAVTSRNVLVVSEAQGGAAGASSASSYRLTEYPTTAPQLRSSAVPTTQSAACWVAVTPNGRYAYTSNAGSSSVSVYRVDKQGALTLLAGQAALTGVNAGALDSAVSPDGQQLHVFASRGLQIASYKIASDGSLTSLGVVGGMPAGSAGMAVN